MATVERLFSHSRRTMVRTVVATGAVLVLAGCPNGDESPEVSRDSKIYGAVIADVANQFELGEPVPDKEPVLFVESFAPDGVPLRVQVELIGDFADDYEMRFVDERAEAVQEDIEDRPVRVGNAFVGVGRIVDEDPDDESVTMRIEVYVDESNLRAYRYKVTERDDDWDIDGSPEEIEPEGFAVAT